LWEGYLPNLSPVKILWRLIFAYVPKPVDPFRGFINGISQPTVEWCLSIIIYKGQAKPKRLGVPIDMEVVARDLKDRREEGA